MHPALGIAALVVLTAAVTGVDARASNQNPDPIWKLSDDGPTVVPRNTTLSLPPGTVVQPSGERSALVVFGTLETDGSKQAPIQFNVQVIVAGRAAAFEASYTHFQLRNHSLGCILTVDDGSANVRTSTFRGTGSGICAGVDASPRFTGMAALTATPSGCDGCQLSPRVSMGGSVGRERILIENTTVEDMATGAHIGPNATQVTIRHATFEGNDVGFRVAGGSARLDHVTIASQAWDIYHTGPPGGLAVQGSEYEPSCVFVEGREQAGCTPGAAGDLGIVALILGLLAAFSLAVFEVIRQAGSAGIWSWLYSRLDREDLLNHPARRRILAELEASPGLHLREVGRRIGGYRKAVYHLERLEENHIVRSEKDGGFRRFYLADQDEDEACPASVREQVLELVGARPGIHAAKAASLLGESRQLVAYHVREAAHDGMVELKPEGNKKRIYLAKGSAEPRAGTD